MHISPVSTKANTYSNQTNGNDEINQLQKQKEQLQDQIQKLKESKIDEKTKMEKVKELQAQIQLVDAEIQRLKNEKLDASKSKENEKVNQSSVTPVDGKDSISGMSQLLQANTSFSKAQVLNKVKNDINGRTDVLKIEVKLDSARGGSTSKKIEEIQKNEAKINKLYKKSGEALKETKDKIDEVSQNSMKDDVGKSDEDKKSSEESNPRNKYKQIDILI